MKNIILTFLLLSTFVLNAQISAISNASGFGSVNISGGSIYWGLTNCGSNSIQLLMKNPDVYTVNYSSSLQGNSTFSETVGSTYISISTWGGYNPFSSDRITISGQTQGFICTIYLSTFLTTVNELKLDPNTSNLSGDTLNLCPSFGSNGLKLSASDSFRGGNYLQSVNSGYDVLWTHNSIYQGSTFDPSKVKTGDTVSFHIRDGSFYSDHGCSMQVIANNAIDRLETQDYIINIPTSSFSDIVEVNDTLLCPGDTAVLFKKNLNNPSAFDWYFGSYDDPRLYSYVKADTLSVIRPVDLFLAEINPPAGSCPIVSPIYRFKGDTSCRVVVVGYTLLDGTYDPVTRTYDTIPGVPVRTSLGDTTISDANGKFVFNVDTLPSSIYFYVADSNYKFDYNSVTISNNYRDTIYTSLITILLNDSNVYIPDSIFKAHLLADVLINSNQDTAIQFSEAKAFGGTISCMNMGIKDLRGVEAFVNLDELLCSYNDIDSIDISQNKKLTFLFCSHNNISSLNFSNNPDLVRVNCHSNPISVLDFSTNFKMETIQANFCQLTSLEVSHLKELKVIETSSNQIPSIDVSNNPKLEELTIGRNQLYQIDVSKNPFLKTFKFQGTSVTSIDISNNLDLDYFACSDNVLENLDLSGHIKLTRVIATNCHLETLNVQNGNNKNMDFFNAKDNPSLMCIRIDSLGVINNGGTWEKDSLTNWNQFDCNLNSGPVVYFADSIFKKLMVNNSNINLNADGEIQYAEAEAFKLVAFINDSNITDLTGLEAFTNLIGLETSATVDSLDLTPFSNLKSLFISSSSMEKIDLAQAPKLGVLRIYGKNFKSLDLSPAQELFTAEIKNTQIKTFDISSNPRLKHIYIWDCPRIQEMDFSKNDSLFFVSMMRNDSVQCVDFRTNYDEYSLPAFLDMPLLNCISVKDTALANNNWTLLDSQMSYKDSCNCNLTSLNTQQISVIEAGLYPNPNNGTFSISSSHKIQSIQVIDNLGQVKKIFALGNTKVFEINIELAGMYLVLINTDQGSIVKKVQVLK